MDVVSRDRVVRTLGEVSPVVDALANRQFDNHVKRIRVFVRPGIRDRLSGGRLDDQLLLRAVQATDARLA